MLELKLLPRCWRSVKKAIAGGFRTVVGCMATRTLLVAHARLAEAQAQGTGQRLCTDAKSPRASNTCPLLSSRQFPKRGCVHGDVGQRDGTPEFIDRVKG